jgi:polysaccharide export outer membrane protein
MRNLLVFVVLSNALALAQFASPRDPAGPQQVIAPQNLPELEIGANDLLNVRVYDSPELSGTVRVAADGTVQLPMLGDHPIKVAGMLPQQVAARIGSELERAQVIVHAVVTVQIAEYQSRTVTVGGAVRHPISFQAYTRITLLDALSRAEGLSDLAGDDILISEPGTGGQLGLIKRVSAQALMSGHGPDGNLLLHGGEEIRVPEAGRVSILGNVKHPGVFPVKTADESSVLTLLARAEGVTPNATDQAYIYRLAEAGQPRSEMHVDLKLILERKAPDVHLEPGDIFYIPDNHARRVTLSVLEHLSTLGAATTSAVIYAGIH